jgi:glycosyltransferase involved in cell wall biosynthesis
MRIVHVTSVFSGTGGVEQVIHRLCEGLRLRGHEVLIAVAGTAPAAADPEGLEVRYFPIRLVAGRYRYPPGMLQFLVHEARRSDVVHAHQPFAVPTQLVALAPGVRVLSPYLHPPTGGRFQLARRRTHLRGLCRHFDAVVCISEAERSLLETVVGRRVPRARVVRPGFDEGALLAEPYAKRRPLVLSVGRIVAHKRVELVLRVGALLSDVADVAIVGEGPERARLASMAQSLGLDPNEVAPGRVSTENLRRLLRTADLYLSLSTEESFGLAVLDAAAAGARLLVSDIPSHREIVRLAGGDDLNLVPLDASAETIAARARALLSASEPSRAPALPSWDDAIDELEGVYREFACARP